MSEHIEPNDNELLNGSHEFYSSLNANVDPFIYNGEEFSEMKYVWLSKEQAQPFTEK